MSALSAGTVSTVDVVGAAAEALRDGRVDDLLGFLHPRVRWYPVSRPARCVYHGHDGTRQMITDIYGSGCELEILDLIPTGVDEVVVSCAVSKTTSIGTRAADRIEVVVTLEDGLIISAESQYPTSR